MVGLTSSCRPSIPDWHAFGFRLDSRRYRKQRRHVDLSDEASRVSDDGAKSGAQFIACHLSFGVARRHADFIGHDQPFFADQGNSAIAQGGLGIVVANQLVSIERTANQAPNGLQSEMIPLMPMPSERYLCQ